MYVFIAPRVTETEGNILESISDFRWKTADFLTGIGFSVGGFAYLAMANAYLGVALAIAITGLLLFSHIKDSIFPVYAAAGLLTGYVLLYVAIKAGLAFPYFLLAFICLFLEDWVLGIGYWVLVRERRITLDTMEQIRTSKADTGQKTDAHMCLLNRWGKSEKDFTQPHVEQYRQQHFVVQ